MMSNCCSAIDSLINQINKDFIKLKNPFYKIFCKKRIVEKIKINIDKLDKLHYNRERLISIMNLSKQTETNDLNIRIIIEQYNNQLLHI